jgi:hypothetical protein
MIKFGEEVIVVVLLLVIPFLCDNTNTLLLRSAMVFFIVRGDCDRKKNAQAISGPFISARQF